MKGGQFLAGGYVGAFAEIRGDWKWLKETLHLQNHYGTSYCCHLCHAHKNIYRLLYTNFQEDATYRRTTTTANGWWQLYAAALLVCPLIMIPGFNIFRVLVDILHTFDLGWYQYTAASVMWQLTEYEGYLRGGTRQARFDDAFSKYKAWCVPRLLYDMSSKYVNHTHTNNGPKTKKHFYSPYSSLWFTYLLLARTN